MIELGQRKSSQDHLSLLMFVLTRNISFPNIIVGRLLAGAVVVGSTPPGRVLAASVAGEPEGHEVVERAEGIGGVPARRSRQRVSVPP